MEYCPKCAKTQNTFSHYFSSLDSSGNKVVMKDKICEGCHTTITLMKVSDIHEGDLDESQL